MGGSEADDLPASQPVSSLTLELKRTATQQAELDAYLKSVERAGSPDYHHWLTPEQFAERFAPTAADVAPVKAWLTTQGLQIDAVSAGGMRLSLSGTVKQVGTAFGVRLQRYALASGDLVMVDGTPTVPSPLAATVRAIADLTVRPLAMPGGMAALEDAVDANATAVVVADLNDTNASPSELAAVLEQASAQGQTVVTTHVARDLLPARALVIASQAEDIAEGGTNATPRPDWQVAPGLPADGLRALPDAAVADAKALQQALQSVVAKSGRIGNVAGRFYAVAPEPRVFTHADSSVAAGEWVAMDGLGTPDLPALIKALDVGMTSPLNSQIVLSTRDLTHGQSITLTATITGGSGTPTGTVTFGSAQDGTIASVPLAAGATAGTAVAIYSTSALPGGLHGFYGTYNGDSTYAVSTTNVDTATVQPEAVTISGTVTGSPAVGTLIPVLVTVKSPSGVGTPSGVVTVNPYGTALDQTAFTGTLMKSADGTATATVNVPATNAGSFTFQASCTTNASFSCAQPVTFPVTERKGTPSFTLSQTGTASAAVLTASVVVPAGAASTVVAPTGGVQFLDNGNVIGNGTLDGTGKATYVGALGGGSTHLVTANYTGDGNYVTATATANAATTKVVPNVLLSVVMAGSSLSAVVTPPSGTVTIPTGSVQFFLGTTVVGSGVLNSTGIATYTGTYGKGILTAVYSGDESFLAATSNAIDTSKMTSSVVLVNTSGVTNTVVLTATVMDGSAVATTATGTITFLDGTTTIGVSVVKAGVASLARSLAITTHSLTAVYSGDANWNGSTSQPLSVTLAPSPAVIALNASTFSAIAGQNITLSAAVSSGVVNPTLIPTGSITFYDTLNGTVVNLGSAVLSSNKVDASYAQLSTTGLRAGTHSIFAVYAGDTAFQKTTSSTVAVNVGDFVLTFQPAAMSLKAGETGTGSLMVGSVNGFSGSIALACTPAPDTQTTCSVSPQIVSTGGTAQFSVTTAKGTAMPALEPRIGAAALLAGVLPLCFARRRRRVAAFLLLLVIATVVSGGCTQVAGTRSDTSGGGGTPISTGTPLGTMNLTITAASIDSPVNARHTYLIPVTVQ